MLLVIFSVFTILIINLNSVFAKESETNFYIDEINHYSFFIPNKYSDKTQDFNKNININNRSAIKPGAVIYRDDKNSYCRTWTFTLRPEQNSYSYTQEKLSEIMFRYTVKIDTGRSGFSMTKLDKYQLINEDVLDLKGHNLYLKVYDLLSSEYSNFTDYRIRMLTGLIFNPSVDYLTFIDRAKDYIYLKCSTYGKPSVVDVTTKEFYKLVKSIELNKTVH